MLKPTRVLTVAVLAVVAGVVTAGALSFLNIFGTTTIDRTGPSVLISLQDLSEFHAASAYYETVVDIEEDGFGPAFIYGERVLYVGKGEVDAIIDFSALVEENIEVSEDRLSVTIDLPSPVPDEPVLNLETSYVANFDSGLVNKFKNSDLERDAQLKAIEQMRAAAVEEGALIEQAKENTISILEGLLSALGFTDITVTFDGA